VKASRWDRLTWGNLAGDVMPISHPDDTRSLLELPTARWGRASIDGGAGLVGLAVTDARYNCPITIYPTRCSNPGP
jgi:hypothetical protein